MFHSFAEMYQMRYLEMNVVRKTKSQKPEVRITSVRLKLIESIKCLRVFAYE